MSCLFCKIIAGEIKSEIVYQNEGIVAFRDVSPQAPTHILIIPRKHIASLNDLTDSDAVLLAQMSLAAKRIAHEERIDEKGYRLVMNCNEDGGQTVFHIHMHLLGGRPLQWPPG